MDKHTAGQAWMNRARSLALQRADASFELGVVTTATETREAYGRKVDADNALDTHLQSGADAIDALRLVASKTVLTSGIRAVVDAALAKAGDPSPAPEAPRHIRICGEGIG
ncbi:hypothetical protein [Burkholderia sp. Bp8990]|uniref:hypothetical protein n=1 Tax=Burkholderia sp. Bp8990 TaxID=2184552 RepID=UPI0021AB2328|nr:hypothetical protein [Burkholderia sp. Bp8990]